MRRTRVQMTIAAMMAAALMSGCGEEPYELTENEQKLIANYSAHIVTKYNTCQNEGLSVVQTPVEETGTEETEVPEESTQIPAAEATETVQQEQTAETEETETSAETAYTPATLDELFGGQNIVLTYAGAELTDSYMEGSYYALYPDAGRQYLVLRIDVANTGTEPAEVDYLSLMPQFQVKLNGDITSPSEQTVLPGDFSALDLTLQAGETEEAVLLFQIPADVEMIEGVELFVTTDGNYQIALENN